MSSTTSARKENNSGQPPRITPRNSDAEKAIANAASKETPYGTLRQLANLPKPTTPLRRASSAGPPSTRRSVRRTPAARTPGAGQRIGGSARKVVVTPHGRAAQRELEARRAGLTPGNDRRKSGRQQRETPRDALRALSRILAPQTLPIVPTPQGPAPSTGKLKLPIQDDLDDGPELERPRLSLPIGDEDDEDDSLILPPRSAGLEDEDITIKSVEFARRAISEQPSRYSRGSFGSIRFSDRFEDLSQLGLSGPGGEGYDSSFTGGIAFDDDMPDMSDDNGPPGDNTATLRDLGLERGRISLASGRNSDIRPRMIPGDDTTNEFVFTVPPRDVSEEHSELVPEPSVEDENEDADEIDSGDEEEADLPSSPQIADPEVNQQDISLQDPTLQDATLQEIEGSTGVKRKPTKKKVKISKHGIPYPGLPAGVVKKLATTYARMGGNSKAKISKETLDAIMQASDWFFEQVSDDLAEYSKHAGRKTIDESDVVTLMARQRQTNPSITPFSLAQKHLPRELLQELRMVPPAKLKKGRQLQRVEEDDEE